jgi:hypothetical protein
VSGGGRGIARWAPWILVAALLVLLASATWKLALDSRRSPHLEPTISDPDEAIAAFRGAAPAGGAEVEFLIAPLHADPDRQRFEALALAQRLGLEEGEPWRLVRRGAADPGAGADELLAPLPASGYVVRDSRGVALRSLEVPPAGELVDPVRSAFAPWLSSDRSTTTCVLWGRAPGAGARLAAVAGKAEIALESSSVHRSELEVPLARLERPGGGKNAPPDASEARDAGRERR